MIPITTIPVGWQEFSPFFGRSRDSYRDTLTSSFQERFNVDNVMFVNTGRAALKIALKALAGTGEGICLPAFTCPVLFEVILSAGLTPIPVDVEYETMGMGEGLTEKAQRGKGVIVVHLFGDPVSVKGTRDAVGDVVVVEDCAQGLGAVSDSFPAGSQGDYAIFSFGLGKTITAGIGGALCSAHETLADVRPSRHIADSFASALGLVSMWVGGRPILYSAAYPLLQSSRHRADSQEVRRILAPSPRQLHVSRLPDAACGVLISQLGRLDKIIETRRRHARMLTDLLRDRRVNFRLSQQAENGTSTFARYVVRVPPSDRPGIMRALIANGVESEIPYGNLLSILPSYGEFPVANRLLGECLTLPIHDGLTEENIHEIATIVSRSRPN